MYKAHIIQLLRQKATIMYTTYVYYSKHYHHVLLSIKSNKVTMDSKITKL